MSDDLVKRLDGFDADDLHHEAADRIEELEAKLREAALSELSALGQASEAYTAKLDAEAKLAYHLEHIVDEYDCIPWGPTLQAINEARATLAELSSTMKG